MYDLVAIGNPVYDEIITPYIRTKGRVLSGCSTNACLAARKLGLAKVALVGCIGSDYEQRFKMHMSRYGVELPKINISAKSGGFKLIYDTLGNRTLDVLGVAGNIRPQDIPEKCLDARVILLAPILQEINIDLIQFLRENSEAQLFLDPQGLIRTIGEQGRIITVCDRQQAAKFTSLVHIIKPNEHESIALTGFENPFMSAKQLVKWGAEVGIVTLADKGSVIRRNNQELAIPAYKTLAKDPTGAGDTYAGAFITKFLENHPLFRCGLFATAAASIKIEHTGPDFPLSRQSVIQRIRELESS
jgi:sugar/nucleoside kinase (ribokinase family)